MHYLTSSTVTELRIQWLLPVDLVGDLTTLAFPSPFDRAELVVGLHQVWGTVFPLFDVEGAFSDEVCGGGFGEGRSGRRDI